MDFTGAITAAATSHNPAYETLTRQNNGGAAQDESNYESLDRGGEDGHQDSFGGFDGGESGNDDDNEIGSRLAQDGHRRR